MEQSMLASALMKTESTGFNDKNRHRGYMKIDIIKLILRAASIKRAALCIFLKQFPCKNKLAKREMSSLIIFHSQQSPCYIHQKHVQKCW